MILKADAQANSVACSEILCAKEQGIISAEQGIPAPEQGILSGHFRVAQELHEPRNYTP
jgi:hypothetical protein